ncbi:hypothetical protein ACQEU6_10610 [Spirillospora sp. CA-108201]
MIACGERLLQRYDLHRGAQIARLDHFNICTPGIPAAYAHYASLGFGCSETIEGDEHELYAAWMYRKQTVHDVAFTGGAGPRLHHVGMVQGGQPRPRPGRTPPAGLGVGAGRVRRPGRGGRPRHRGAVLTG